jgi:hypothetical protein
MKCTIALFVWLTSSLAAVQRMEKHQFKPQASAASFMSIAELLDMRG